MANFPTFLPKKIVADDGKQQLEEYTKGFKPLGHSYELADLRKHAESYPPLGDNLPDLQPGTSGAIGPYATMPKPSPVDDLRAYADQFPPLGADDTSSLSLPAQGEGAGAASASAPNPDQDIPLMGAANDIGPTSYQGPPADVWGALPPLMQPPEPAPYRPSRLPLPTAATPATEGLQALRQSMIQPFIPEPTPAPPEPTGLTPWQAAQDAYTRSIKPEPKPFYAGALEAAGKALEGYSENIATPFAMAVSTPRPIPGTNINVPGLPQQGRTFASDVLGLGFDEAKKRAAERMASMPPEMQAYTQMAYDPLNTAGVSDLPFKAAGLVGKGAIAVAKPAVKASIAGAREAIPAAARAVEAARPGMEALGRRMADETGAVRLGREGLTPEDMDAVGRTDRSGTFVKTPQGMVKAIETFNPQAEQTVLNFGSGKDPQLVRELEGKGAQVTNYEVPRNVRPGVHDPAALSRQYDVVVASSVLNVQPNERSLATTISQLADATARRGRAIIAYPLTPRKMSPTPLTPSDILERLSKRFEDVRVIGGSLADSSPVVFEARGSKLTPGNVLRNLATGERGALEIGRDVAPVPTKRYYHGTGSAFETPEPGKFDPNGLYGPGYYLTDEPEVAASYATQPRAIKQQSLQAVANLEGLRSAYQKRLADTLTPELRQSTEQEIKRIQRVLDEHYQATTSGPNVRAVEVPQGLNLLDIEGPIAPDEVRRIAALAPPESHLPMMAKRWEETGAIDHLRGDYIYRSLRDIGGPSLAPGNAEANLILQSAGYDGIRYPGGQIMPLKDAAGNPIEHEAVVIFPESLPKIRNAVSGLPMGSAPEVGGSILGGVAAYDPNATPEENARRVPLGMVGGGIGAHALTRGIKPGFTVQAVGGERAPAYYSQLERVLESPKAPNKAGAESYTNFLKAQGVKDEELRQTGVKAFLDERTASKLPVTRTELQEAFLEGQVQLKEVVKGQPFQGLKWVETPTGSYVGLDTAGQQANAISRLGNGMYRLRDDVNVGAYPTLDAAKQKAEEFAGNKFRADTKFSQYQLPGAKPGSYREWVLTFPEKTVSPGLPNGYIVEKAWHGDGFIVKGPNGETLGFGGATESKAIESAMKDARYSATKQANYQSPHWDEPNPLAHIRFNDRIIDGKKTLFVEEIQSDWHQTGRREGYQPTAREAAHADELKIKQANGDITLAERADLDAWNSRIGHAGVPDAPFKKSWPTLAMKRAIKWAADNGYERIAWTTGAQQAERYDLRKVVDSLRWSRADDGSYLLWGRKDGVNVIELPTEGRIAPDKLTDHIGKDAAGRIAAAEGKSGELVGNDLAVGGEGMTFYDRELVNIANDLGKKYGARVREGRVGTRTQTEELAYVFERPDGRFMVSDRSGQLPNTGIYTTREDAQRALDRFTAPVDAPVHVLDLPSAMTAEAKAKGFSLFSPPEIGAGLVGAYSGYDPNKPLEENLPEMTKRGVLGVAGMHALRTGKMGLSVEDVSKGINRLTANAADLAADYKARGMDKRRAWDQYIIDKAIKPDMDAKDFYRVYDQVTAQAIATPKTAPGQPTHIIRYGSGNERRVQIVEDTPTLVRWVDEFGSTGSDPKMAEGHVKSIEPIAPAEPPIPAPTPTAKKPFSVADEETSVISREGQAGQALEGVSRAQVGRYYARLNAEKLAEKLRYRNGQNVKIVIDDLYDQGGVPVLEGANSYIEMPDGSQIPFRAKTAQDYIKTRYDLGEFKRNYELPEAATLPPPTSIESLPASEGVGAVPTPTQQAVDIQAAIAAKQAQPRGPYAQFLQDLDGIQAKGTLGNVAEGMTYLSPTAASRMVQRAIRAYDEKVISQQELYSIIEQFYPEGQWAGRPEDVVDYFRGKVKPSGIPEPKAMSQEELDALMQDLGKPNVSPELTPALTTPEPIKEKASLVEQGAGTPPEPPQPPIPPASLGDALPPSNRGPRPTMEARFAQWQAEHPEAVPPGGTVPPTGKTPPGGIPPEGPPPELPSGRTPGGPERAKPVAATDPLEQLEDSLKPESKPFGAVVGEKFNAFMRATYDRNFDIGWLEKNTGIPAHKLAQLVSGATAAGEDRIRRFALPVVEPLGKDVKHLEEYMVLQRSKDLLAFNKDANLPGNLAGWQDVIAAEKRLRATLGPDRFNAVKAAAEKLTGTPGQNDGVFYEQILKPLLDNGLLSKEALQAMRSKHPHYIDFHRADFSLVDGIENVLRRPEASVADIGIKRMDDAGSARKLDQPLARSMAQIIRTKNLISRNKAAHAIVAALDKMQTKGLLPKDSVRRLTVTEAAEHSNVTDTISYFVDGKKVTYQVPPVYATIGKGLEAETAQAYQGVLAVLSAPLRMGAVTYNPIFIVANPIRDAWSAFFREGLVPFSPEYVRGWVAAITQNADFSDAAEAGVLMSGIVDTMRSTEAMARASRLGAIKVESAKDALLLIPRLIERANLTAEQATKIATYHKLKDQGLSRIEAAVRGRDVTVDFAKAGNVMKVINQIIPFSNAGVQGASNTLRLLKDNPKQALIASGVLAMPTIVAYALNSRFETSKMIPEYEYVNNYVFMIGEGTKNPDPKSPNAKAEKFPIYVKIPKGPTAAAVTLPAELAMRLAWAKDDRSIVEQLWRGTSIGAQLLSPVGTDISGVMPPILGTAAGIALNKDPFRGRDIVPLGEQRIPPEMQYGGETSSIAVALGDKFKVSPRMIDFAIKDYTAGVGQQSLWLSDLGLGALGYDPEARGAVKVQALTGPQQTAKIPGIGRFYGTQNTQQGRMDWEKFDRTVETSQREFMALPEVKRLGLTLGPVGDTISLAPNVRIQLELPERAALQQSTVRELVRLASDLASRPAYKQLPDAAKRKAMDSVLSKGRDDARKSFLQQFTHEELRQRVTEAFPIAVGQ